MDIEVLKSYLVDLGFSVNQPELRKFELGMKDAAAIVEAHTVGIVKDVFKWQAAITGAFVGVSSSVIAMADHVAMADQQYRLMGLRMFMTTEHARKLQIGMDALGASLAEIAWDPELNAHFLQLADDQDRMAKGLGANFAQTMRSIRDLRFEYTRLKVASEYLSMQLVESIFSKLGLTLGDVQGKLEQFVLWFQDQIPTIAGKLGDDLVPILTDTWDILKSLGSALVEVGTAFTNVIGALTGDKTIEGATFNFENFGTAILHVADFLADFAKLVTDVTERVAHLISGIALLLSGKWSAANDEGNAIFKALPELEEQKRNREAREAKQRGGDARAAVSKPENAGSPQIHDLITQTAQAAGLDPRIAHGVALQESGERQYDKNGNVVANPGSSARGIFQLLSGTAQGLGVDRTDTMQNIQGGVKMLADLVQKYRGSEDKALAAYYWGPGNLDKALASHQAIPPEVLNYVRGVHSKEGQSVTIGEVAVHITQPGASAEEIRRATTQGVAEAMRKQTTRTQAQLAYVG